MANGDEEKEIVAVVGGDENQWSPPPPGFRFSPTDDELVEYYLLPRLQGRPHVPNDAIIEDYVYRCHPDDLILKGEYKDRGQDDVWYFLSSRSRKYGNGDRPSRMTEDGRGRWKATTGSKSVVTACQGVQYTHSGLGYHDGPIKEEDKGKWLMHELTVPEYENKVGKKNVADRSGRDTLDEYVMCKIYMTTRETKKEKKKKKRDEAGPSGTASQPGPAAAECSQETEPEPNVSERQKGKRPVVENTKKRRRVEAARPKQELPAPDRCLGPQPQGDPTPTQFYGGATQMRFGNTGYQHHYGGTGRPMAYNPHASMPRQPMAFNGQVPPYQAPPSPSVFAQSMMMPHLAPPGQAFRPPRPAAVPGYPAMQRPPETAEMRERRVYQQHINAMRRMMQQQLGNPAAYAAHQPRPTMAFMQHQQQQQQPYFGAGFNHHLVRPMAPQFLPCNYHQPLEEVGQQVQCSYSVQDSGAVAATPAETEAGSAGVTDEVADVGGDCNNDEDKGSVEVVTKKALPDGGTAPTDGDDTEEDSTSQ